MMMIQPDASHDFASVRTPIFTDTLCFKLVNCLQGLIECILLDEHGTVCRRLEAELPENSNELKWDGLNDLPYGIYTLQMLQGSNEMNMRLIKRV